MPANGQAFLRRELTAYGVQSKSLTLFGSAASPELVDYLDLVPNGGARASRAKVLPDGVAESQGRPLLYVVSRARLAVDARRHDAEIRELRRTLGSRGERSYLAIVEPGQLSVVPITLSSKTPDRKQYSAGTEEAATFFSRLGLGLVEEGTDAPRADYLFDEMFRLLTHAADRLVTESVSKRDVLSLVGRALFFRFLCDREIVTESNVSRVAPMASSLKACFGTPDNAAATCAWLDRTFNGDFLPLADGGSVGFFETVGRKTSDGAFRHLSAILHGHEPAGKDYQRKLDWGDFDFAHVPVGLLSQVNEAFSWKWDPHAKSTSIYYTPRRIADYVVEEAFAGLPAAENARVLDPACGAGVFLVLAFRRLYQASWRATGRRPDTKEIRRILESQITGFDVSEYALRLAALSLYLTAIEVDPAPVPPDKLGFKPMRNRVLFNLRRDDVDPGDGPVLGSLGNHVGPEHRGKYNIVLCNPPWTSLPKGKDDQEKARFSQLADEYTKLSREALDRRGLPELAKDYNNPDKAPDLPFVWRSLDWCKADGRIGLVLPGRVLFKQERVPRRAREALFRSVAVTGIINGSNLSDTPVWPKMGQPFMLLFARNRPPRRNHALRWVTPYCDVALNGRGGIRIDSKSVEMVDVEATFAEPWLWKALAIGTSLDVDVVRKVKSANGRLLHTYWKTDLQLVSGNGYQIKEKQKQNDAKHLKDLPNLDSTDVFRFVVDPNRLKPFSRTTACFPRRRELYRAPLALLKESPGIDRSKGLALLSFKDVAFNESFHGFSAFGAADAQELARYLHLFMHSSLWMHYALLTSPKLGVERRKIYKSDLEHCPIIPWDRLTQNRRTVVVELSQRLVEGDPDVFEDIDAFFAGLYGLNKHDAEVIRDTLAVAMPYDEVRKKACEFPSQKQREVFRARLESGLRPFFRKLRQEVHVSPWPREKANSLAPYSVLLIGTASDPPDFPEDLFEQQVLPLANRTGTSRVIFEADGGLVVGALNQQRYWTPSRARLCAAEILQRHMAVFEE